MQPDLTKVIEGEKAANAAASVASDAAEALRVAERALRDEEFALRELLKKRGTFNEPSRDELTAANERVGVANKAVFDAKAKHDFAVKAFHAARDKIARAKREAYEPLKSAAIARMVEVSERLDAKRNEMAMISAEFEAAQADLQAAVAAGAHARLGGGVLSFAASTSTASLRTALRGVFGMAAA